MQQDRSIDALNAYCQAEGLQVVEQKEIPYGHQVKITDGIEAVSYTHLDVYKRQVDGCESGRRATVAGYNDA